MRFFFAEHFGGRLTLSKSGSKKAVKQAAPVESVKNDTASQVAPEGASPVAVSLVQLPSLPALPSGVEPVPPLKFYLNLEWHDYLKTRGILPETAKAFGVGLCRRGSFNGYICAPIYNYPRPENENPIAYIGRWPAEDYEQRGVPRYRLPEGFPKTRAVYNLDRAMAAPPGPLVVVESVWSVWRMAQCGLPRVVAVFGSFASDEQIALLLSTRRPLLLLLDGDEAGLNGARQAAARLIQHCWLRAIRLPAQTQPHDLSAQQLKQLLSFLS